MHFSVSMYTILKSFVQSQKWFAQTSVRLQHLETLAPTITAFFQVKFGHPNTPTPSATPPLLSNQSVMSLQDPLHHFEGWTIADDLNSVRQEKDMPL